MPSRYDPLTVYLRGIEGDAVRLTFNDIESILRERLPDSARKHAAWWSNSDQKNGLIWLSAGFRAQVSFTGKCVHFERLAVSNVAHHPPMASEIVLHSPSVEHAVISPAGRSSGPRSRWRVDDHFFTLDRDFEKYLSVFESRRIFTGPSVYFYQETLKVVRDARSLLELSSNDHFMELIYATLTSWGMHRMGERVTTKLTEFPVFRAAIRALLEPAASLTRLRITTTNMSEVDAATQQLASLVDRGGISTSGSPLVANAKTLHFLLPDLMPPIDRTYTGRFFYGPSAGMILPHAASHVFRFIFPQLANLARRHVDEIGRAMRRSYFCGGEAKALDNAIVGYMLTHSPAGNSAAP